MTTTSWTAGARSVQTLAGDGWFSFSVPLGSVGVFVGVGQQDESTLPTEPIIGFMFTNGAYRIDMRGAPKTTLVPYSSGQVFSIVRHGNTIYCCAGSQMTSYAGVPFDFPGTVLYVQTVGSLGPLLLDASLLGGGDSVVGASMTNAPDEATAAASASISMPPMTASAAASATGEVFINFQPMRAAADQGRAVSMVMEPLTAMATEGVYGAVGISFEPLAVDAFADVEVPLRGASVSLGYPTVEAAGPGDVGVSLQFWPAGVSSGDDPDLKGVSLGFLPAYLFASGDTYAGDGVRFVVGLSGPVGGDGALRDVVDGALASDEAEAASYTMVNDGALASDLATVSADTWGLVVDTAIASESATTGTTAIATDGAWASDTPVFSSFSLVADGALASDGSAPSTHSLSVLLDGALAGDAALPFAVIDVLSSAIASDSIVLEGMADATDTAIASDECMPATELDSTLESAAIAWSESWMDSHSIAALVDTAVADEVLLMKRPGLVAWVMNADTGAVSWYDNWAFTDMAVVGGKVFASGPDGLVVLGGEADGADTIDARVEYGFNEFGGYDQAGRPKPNEQKKRVPGLWFGYHADGVLAATVGTYGQGYGTFRYAMEPRKAGQPRSNRVEPGKGLNARYWRIGIENKSGCAFEVHSIAAELAQSTRRI